MKYIPHRKCVVCRKIQPKEGMFRISRMNDGTYQLDTTNFADGRGAYLCKNHECIKQAIQKRSLNQAFKTKVPDECYDILKNLLEEYPQ